MTDLPTASSPVEIEAEADEKGLDQQAREAALALFHNLTSRLELASLDLTTGRSANWPSHRFYFGRQDSGDLARVLVTLRERPDALNVTAASPSGTAVTPATLFVDGVTGAFAAVLVACADADVLHATAEALERR